MRIMKSKTISVLSNVSLFLKVFKNMDGMESILQENYKYVSSVLVSRILLKKYSDLVCVVILRQS